MAIDDKDKLLLIWDENPESIKLYLFNADGKMAERCRKAQGGYINSSDTSEDHPVHELNEWLDKDKAKEFLVEAPISDYRITEVVMCGFLM